MCRLFHEGDPVARVEVERVLLGRTVRAALEVGRLLDVADTGYLRSTSCALQVRVTPDSSTWAAYDFPWTTLPATTSPARGARRSPWPTPSPSRRRVTESTESVLAPVITEWLGPLEVL